MTQPRDHMPGHDPSVHPTGAPGTGAPGPGAPGADAGVPGPGVPGAGVPGAGAPRSDQDHLIGADPDQRAREQSLGDMLKEVSRDLSTLIRQEVELAKAELRESATKAGKGAGMFTGAALAGYMVLLFLSLAAWAGISNLTGPVWAAIIVAIIWAIIAAILALKGKKEMKAVEGVPQTTQTVKEIPEALK